MFEMFKNMTTRTHVSVSTDSNNAWTFTLIMYQLLRIHLWFYRYLNSGDTPTSEVRVVAAQEWKEINDEIARLSQLVTYL